MTVALEGDEWSAARTGCSLLPGKIRYPFYVRLDGPQRSVWTGGISRPHRDSIPDQFLTHNILELNLNIYVCVLKQKNFLCGVNHQPYRKEDLNDLYCSPNIVRVLKWRKMRWAGHVARMGEERMCIGSC